MLFPASTRSAGSGPSRQGWDTDTTRDGTTGEEPFQRLRKTTQPEYIFLPRDIKQTMPGDVAGIEKEVKERIRVLAPGGGYIVAPANHLQPDVPPANVVALYDGVRRFGKYPLEF